MTRRRLVFAILYYVVLAVGFGRGGLVGRAAEAPTLRSVTLRDCVTRALAENLDLRVERFNPQIQAYGILREQSVFEPAWVTRYVYRDSDKPLDPEQSASFGTNILKSTSGDLSSSIMGRLPTGTQYELGVTDNRFYSLHFGSNHVHTGAATLTLTQPLLRNFGWWSNLAGIRVARQDHQIALAAFSQQVINIVTEVSRVYYDLIAARELFNARTEDLALAGKFLVENRKRVEAGLMSPLEVTQAQAGLAGREEAALLARLAITESENNLKRLLHLDPAEWETTSLVPADPIPVDIVALDETNSVRLALANRLDYRQLHYELEKRGILRRYQKNQLFPAVDLLGSYGWNGRGNTFSDYVSNSPDSLGDQQHPEWSVGVVVSIPLGNAKARAEYHSARLAEEQVVWNLKRYEQEILVQVKNGLARIFTNAKRIEATGAASRLAEEVLRAEQQRLRAGLSTSILVLQAQSYFANARAAEIRARTDYAQSLTELDRIEGRTLERHEIVLDQTP